jgi:nickel-dependent lactate racemase
MWFYKEGKQISEKMQEEMMERLLHEAGKRFNRSFKKVLLLPPDITRYHSGVGKITNMLYHILGHSCYIDIIPTLGQHVPHTQSENQRMFGDIPERFFHVHDWKFSYTLLGEISEEFVKYVTNERADWSIPVEINRAVVEGHYDLIVNIGQTVPHEVLGFANHNKNYFIGLGGKSTICASHMMAAAYGIEDNLGQIVTPLRGCYIMAESDYLKNVPDVYVLVVKTYDSKGELHTTGMYIGDDIGTYMAAARYAREHTIHVFEKPLKKVVCMMDENEFKSTWVANKAIYRTRKVIADGGELLIIAPGVERFGEQKEVDHLIRKYGYKGMPNILNAYTSDAELHELSHEAAHLIHGSSEGRFKIIYAPGKLTRKEIEGVGFDYISLAEAIKNYKPESLKEGINKINGEEFYFIPSPSLGLWTAKEKFIDSLNTNLAFAKRMKDREPDEITWRQLVDLDNQDIGKYKPSQTS